jgi:hypothetical protein
MTVKVICHMILERGLGKELYYVKLCEGFRSVVMKRLKKWREVKNGE